jgi:hypothetical protein
MQTSVLNIRSSLPSAAAGKILFPRLTMPMVLTG